MTCRAGLFLDRDGTIIEDGGYMRHPDQIVLLSGAREALHLARRSFRIYLVTNQSGIGRGLLSRADVDACNRRMLELLALPEPVFEGICIAPETPEEPPRYRKPSPRYLLETIRKDGLDAAACWMAGDRLSDLQCGLNACIRSALVRQSEHAQSPEVQAFVAAHGVPVFDSLLDFIVAAVSGGEAGAR